MSGSIAPATCRKAAASITNPGGTASRSGARMSLARFAALPPHEASASARSRHHMDRLYRVAYDRAVRLAPVFLMVLLGSAAADTSKLAKEDVPLQTKGTLRGKNKLCCGYPLAPDLGFALR